MTELESELRSLASAIDFPEPPDIASNIRVHVPDPRRTAWRRRIALAVAIAVMPSAPASPCRKRGARFSASSASERCRSSSSTACRRYGPRLD